MLGNRQEGKEKKRKEKEEEKEKRRELVQRKTREVWLA